ncbi:MAG: alpha/beta hydrolase, partial [Bacteroidetes bacterium]|nr:alpha/beta hydrolase [Bacteroidota bacterium]
GRVIALVTVSSGLIGYDIDDKEVKENGEKMYMAFNQGKMDTVVEYNLRSWVDGPKRRPSQVDTVIRNKAGRLGRFTYDNWNPKVKQRPLEPPAIKRLAEITVPTLLIVGDLDMPSIDKIADLMVKKIKGAQKVVVKGAGQLVNMEKPTEFNAVLGKFLNSLK